MHLLVESKSRYGTTTPALERWFKKYNENKPYSERVKPFNFLLAMQSDLQLNSIKPVAPFHSNPSKALLRCFDRDSGEKIKQRQLKTYLDILAQYHLHPEAKFLSADYLDQGKTLRRHVIVKSIQLIGKEVNKWEEQFFTGFNSDAQIDYGICTKQRTEILASIINSIDIYGTKRMAEAANLFQRHVFSIYKGKTNTSDTALAKLQSAGKILESSNAKERELRERIKRLLKEQEMPIRKLAIILTVA